MTQEEMEYTIIRNSVSTLAALCAGSEEKIIDLLTGYLWDEEEAGGIKGPLNKGNANGSKMCCYNAGLRKFEYCNECGSKIENFIF